jgi:hypothetical protein
MALRREYGALLRATKETTRVHQVLGRFIGKVVDAYDGDTCRVAAAFPVRGGGPPRIEYLRVRMLGYDAPEMKRVKGLDHRPYGLEVREAFRALVLGRMVVVDVPPPERPDPYGRVLGRLYVAEAGAPLRGGGGLLRACCCRRAEPGAAASEGAVFVIRGREVLVPGTADVPSGYRADGARSLAALLDVNRWMLEHGRVKPCAGKRAEWTVRELADGV